MKLRAITQCICILGASEKAIRQGWCLSTASRIFRKLVKLASYSHPQIISSLSYHTGTSHYSMTTRFGFLFFMQASISVTLLHVQCKLHGSLTQPLIYEALYYMYGDVVT
jgi:hypothetical protein